MSWKRMSPGCANRLFVRFLAVQVVLSLAVLLWWMAGAEPRLNAEQGLLTPSAKKSTFTYDFHNHKITVWQYEPLKAGKYPALAMLYGLECLAADPKDYELIAQRFAAKGYVVQMFHYFNCTPIQKELAPGFQERIKECLCPKGPEVEDRLVKQHFQEWMAAVKAGIVQLRQRDDVIPEQVSLIGFSLGGFVAMSLVATEPDLSVAAVVQCFAGLPKELHRTIKSAPPVLIFHSHKDDIVPVQEAQTLKALLKAKNCVCEDKIFEDVGHMFLNPDGTLNFVRVFEAEQICLQFLDRHVKNGKNDNGKAPK